MIAVDANLLVYAHREDCEWHKAALRALVELAESGKVKGPMIHDARIAAICLHHGVKALWTADRDFSRFPDLPCVNPLHGLNLGRCLTK